MKKFYAISGLFLAACIQVYGQEAATSNAIASVDYSDEALMNMSLEELLNVRVVAAGKKEEKLSEIPASAIIVTRKEIQAYGYNNLTEILANVPGLYMIDDYSSKGAMVGIRGFFSSAPKNVMILVNGVDYSRRALNVWEIARIPVPVEAIDRIEIVRGPLSTVYGSGAFFGVINIITNDATAEKKSLVSVVGGSEKTTGATLVLSGNKDGLKYTVNAAHYGTDGPDLSYSDMVANPAALVPYGIGATDKTGNALAYASKYFNGAVEYKGLLVDISLNTVDKYNLFYLPSYPKGDRTLYTYNSSKFFLSYNRDFSPQWGMKWKVDYISDNLSGSFGFHSASLPNYIPYQPANQQSNSYAAEWNVFYKPTPRLSITPGLFWQSITSFNATVDNLYLGAPNINNFSQVKPGSSVSKMAGFVQADFEITPKLKAVAGIRADHLLDYDVRYGYSYRSSPGAPSAANPRDTTFNRHVSFANQADISLRLALMYALSSKSSLKFLFAQAINQPSVINVIDNLKINQATPTSERIQSYEINYLGAVNKNLLVNVSVFHNELNNLFIRQIITLPNGAKAYSVANNSSAATTGAELSLTLRPLKHLSVEISGTYQQTKDRTVGMESLPFNYSPTYLGYCKTSYAFAGKKLFSQATVSLLSNYVGAMESFWDDNKAQVDKQHNNGRLGAKTAAYVNLGANVHVDDLVMPGLYINIHAKNLTGQSMQSPTTPEVSWATKYLVSTGQQLYISVGYKF